VPVHNGDIARLFDQIAGLLEIRGEDPLCIRAYRNAAREVRSLARRQGLKIDEIDRLNERPEGLRLLKGIEVGILEDGSPDLPDEVLGRLDLVIGAVPSALGFANLRYGIGQARRGWLETEDVLDTCPLQVLVPLLRRTM
jgi:histidinol phosphatase-like PHP family hydrolase